MRRAAQSDDRKYGPRAAIRVRSNESNDRVTSLDDTTIDGTLHSLMPRAFPESVIGNVPIATGPRHPLRSCVATASEGVNDTAESIAARGALIAVLIYARPLCIACMAEKSGLDAREVQSYLDSIERTVEVNRGVDRCRSCGRSTTTYSLVRTD